MNSPPPRLIDIGANLTNKAFHADLPEVLSRAHNAGVTTIVITGTSVADSETAAALAHTHGHYATAGVHPHHAKDTTAGFTRQLKTLLQQPHVVAVGECGLDYDRDFSPRDMQRACFEEQLALAAATRKPVFLHERAAHDDFFAIVKSHREKLTNAVVHCFTGTANELNAYLDLDLHIGITGWICDDRRGAHLRELMARIPANRLMLETDAPYLLPKNMPAAPKSRRNEPAFLPAVLSTVARARNESSEALAASSTATAEAFFALPRLRTAP